MKLGIAWEHISRGDARRVNGQSLVRVNRQFVEECGRTDEEAVIVVVTRNEWIFGM